MSCSLLVYMLCTLLCLVLFYWMGSLLEMSSHVSQVRSLYKKILFLHRTLPLHLKALGDQYVKDEFRKHKNVAPAEAKLFMKEWESYAGILWQQAKEGLNPDKRNQYGAPLSKQKLDALSEEQIGQLHELMQEASKPKTQFDVTEDAGKER
ncbi:succinate dehydrogenase assembly factor 3, mitochondrial isoform X2 [Pseudophryne corroboree]|uniref:succinate dehydrogenase assembly factor 3, mitochondrial isoform X2 n=1 Tax=Pseudophryne corroboree TaxID=495146 RepID=UPI00308219DD